MMSLKLKGYHIPTQLGQVVNPPLFYGIVGTYINLE